MEPSTEEKALNQEYTDTCTQIGDLITKTEGLKIKALEIVKRYDQLKEKEKVEKQ